MILLPPRWLEVRIEGNGRFVDATLAQCLSSPTRLCLGGCDAGCADCAWPWYLGYFPEA